MLPYKYTNPVWSGTEEWLSIHWPLQSKVGWYFQSFMFLLLAGNEEPRCFLMQDLLQKPSHVWFCIVAPPLILFSFCYGVFFLITDNLPKIEVRVCDACWVIYGWTIYLLTLTSSRHVWLTKLICKSPSAVILLLQSQNYAKSFIILAVFLWYCCYSKLCPHSPRVCLHANMLCFTLKWSI